MLCFVQQILQHGAVQVNPAECRLTMPDGYAEFKREWSARIIASPLFQAGGMVPIEPSESDSDIEVSSPATASRAASTSKQPSLSKGTTRSASGRRNAAPVELKQSRPTTEAELKLFNELLPAFVTGTTLHSVKMSQEWKKHLTKLEDIEVSVWAFTPWFMCCQASGLFDWDAMRLVGPSWLAGLEPWLLFYASYM
jgi:hypothetical protein